MARHFSGGVFKRLGGKKSRGQPLFLRRGVYIVEGSRYDFEDVLAKSGLKIEEESLLVEQLKDQPTKICQCQEGLSY